MLRGAITGTGASPSVAGGVVYYTQNNSQYYSQYYSQNNGQVGGFDARGCGDVVCSPPFDTGTQPFDGFMTGFMTTRVIINGRLHVTGPSVGTQPAMWVYRSVSLPPAS